jgi:hypothetical protein
MADASLGRHVVQEECSYDPDRLCNKTTMCLRLLLSSDGSYPEIEYDGCGVGDFEPGQAPCEKWCHILIPLFRPNLTTGCGCDVASPETMTPVKVSTIRLI